MKVLLRKLMLVLIVIFSVFMAGNVYSSGKVYKETTRTETSNSGKVYQETASSTVDLSDPCYCQLCDKIYFGRGTHIHKKDTVSHVVVAPKDVVCSNCGTHYPSSSGYRHICPSPVKVVRNKVPVAQRRKQLQSVQPVTREIRPRWEKFLGPTGTSGYYGGGYAAGGSSVTPEKSGYYYSSNNKSTHFSLADQAFVNINLSQRPYRYGIINRYGYGGYYYGRRIGRRTSYIYNQSGRNIFRSRDYRGYRGGGYRSYGW